MNIGIERSEHNPSIELRFEGQSIDQNPVAQVASTEVPTRSPLEKMTNDIDPITAGSLLLMFAGVTYIVRQAVHSPRRWGDTLRHLLKDRDYK